MFLTAFHHKWWFPIVPSSVRFTRVCCCNRIGILTWFRRTARFGDIHIALAERTYAYAFQVCNTWPAPRVRSAWERVTYCPPWCYVSSFQEERWAVVSKRIQMKGSWNRWYWVSSVSSDRVPWLGIWVPRRYKITSNSTLYVFVVFQYRFESPCIVTVLYIIMII